MIQREVFHLQNQLASRLALLRKEADAWVNTHLQAPDDSAMNACKRHDLLTHEIELIFAKAKKLLPPTGFKKFFFMQTENDRQQLDILCEDLRRQVTYLLEQRFSNDRVVRNLRAEIRQYTLATAKKPAPAPKPIRPTSQSVVVEDVRRHDTNSNDDTFTNVLILNALMASQSSVRVVEEAPIISGGGGDFGGGGSTGSWEDTTPASSPVQQCTADDLVGAGSFS